MLRILLFTVLVALLASPALAQEKLRVYFGTYNGKESKGIYTSELDLSSGKLTEAKLAAEVRDPSFLAIHPSKKFLYCVGEISDFGDRKTGTVSALAIDPATGLLTPLNQESSMGAGPCHLIVDKAGKNVLVANYGGGSVACLTIGADGKLGPATSFFQHSGTSGSKVITPRAHSVNLDKDNRYAFVADLGLNIVQVYTFDAAKGQMQYAPPANVPAGSGPRHFAFHPAGKFAYVINETSLTVTAFSYDAEKGVLKEIQTVTTLPQGEKKQGSTAEVQVHPSGKFLYGSNRGHDSLAIFSIDEQNGKLTPVGHQPTGGKTPRNFGIDPTGQYILAANQGSSTVVVHKVDQQTGLLTAGQSISVPNPVCVKFLR